MTFVHSWSASLAVILLLAGHDSANAQRRPRPAEPTFSIEAYTGFSTYSRFIEQHVLVDNALPPLGQRTLKTDVAYILGGSLGKWFWYGTNARLGYTWATTEFEYLDTSGFDRDLLDRNDLNSLNTHIISLEILQLILPARRLSPYLLAGINGEFWVLGDDDQTDAITTTTGSQFRWGGNGGIGLHYRASNSFAIRIEANTFVFGSPFRGHSAFIPESGLTFDKPDYITMPRYTLGLIYTFLRRR